MYSDPWELKYFDFSDFINSSRVEFTGRHWLYREMESVLTHTNKRGVLITGNPGSGKSAFLSNLLYSNRSSPIIHRRILGYHFCMHFNTETKVGANFVRNLANMIAWRITTYRQVILTDSFIRRVLYKDCPKDPEWCFEQGILTPLKKIQQQSVETWYIVIDAMDECADAKAEILNILKYKVCRLPNWIKLIVSSRNVSTIVASLNELERVDLRSNDQRNLDDINSYIFLKVVLLKESIMKRIKTTLAIADNEAPSQNIVSSLAEKGQGNFQYIKIVLDLWLGSKEGVSWDTFPKTLDSSYQLYFERKYSTTESFQSLRQIFEIIVAAHTPLTIHDMYSLLKLEYPTLDLEYELMPKIDQVSLFLWHGSGDGLIRIHHASLSEWLTSDTNKGKFYYIKKQNGHKLLARYHLAKAEKNNLQLKANEAFYLACHVVEGGLDESMVQRFLSLPSDHINRTDPVTQMTAIHHSSSLFNADVTKLLSQHFSNIDCIDSDHRTPSFISATSGRLNNLKTLFKRGANLNYTVTYADFEMASHSQDPVNECRRKWCEYSLLHTAAEKGNIDVVNFLVQHKVDILKATGTNNTAIQLAAGNGHLKTIQALRRAGGKLDIISLHHAAAGGHNDVVRYLLSEGIKDTCIQDTPSIMYPKQDGSERKVHSYDNRHLYLRETALHAAVRKGHLSVIKSLLSKKQSAISCTNSAGRRPLHEAVHMNHYNALEVLLASGANVSVQCDAGTSFVTQHRSFKPDEVIHNPCPCGFSALHIAAMYGHHSAATLLIKHKMDVNARDCTGSTPLHIASCVGVLSIMTLLVENGADVDAPSLNGSTPLHSAAVCFSKASIRRLFDLGCDHYTTDDEGMTALHYVLKDTDVVGFEYLLSFDLYAKQPKDWIENEKGVSQVNKRNEKFPWLAVLVELVICSSTPRNIQDTPFIWMVDRKNQSVWDTLAEKTNVSSVYIAVNRDLLGPGLFAWLLTPLGFASDFTLNELLLKRGLEYAIAPQNITRQSWKTVITIFPESIKCSVLLNLVSFNFVHSVNTAFQEGLNVNCRDVQGITPLLVYLRTGGRHMSKVLVKHKVEVEITCGIPFESSVFHLASYHKLHYLHYISEFLLGSDNWVKYLQTENAIFDYFVDRYDEENNNEKVETFRTEDGPLTLAILSHPNGNSVIDECFDAEGYNALQRAAQGANLIAMKKFLSLGANPLRENAHGFSSLWLSVLNAVKYRQYSNLDSPSVLTALEVELASLSASAILKHVLTNGTLDVGCNKNRYDLTLYHVAASRGMWKFVEHLLSEKKLKGMDVNCPNKDGITPMYLAKVFGGDSCEWRSPWCKVVDVIEKYGGIIQYPTFEAEYFLVNRSYPRMAGSFSLYLTKEEIITLEQGKGVRDCQNYDTFAAVDLLTAYFDFERVYTNYEVKRDKCILSKLMSEEDCPTENLGLPHLNYVLLLRDRQCKIKDFLLIRNCLSNSLDNEIKQLRELLFDTIKSHSEVSTDDFAHNTGHQMAKILLRIMEDPLSLGLSKCFEAEGQEWGLRGTYRTYKQLLKLASEDVNEMKSVIRRTLPSFLAKMDIALRNLNTALNCDWQVIAMKCVYVEFYLSNLSQILNFYEDPRKLAASNFVAGRTRFLFLQPSTEILKLLSRLSGPPSDPFRYLDILTFNKPPM